MGTGIKWSEKELNRLRSLIAKGKTVPEAVSIINDEFGTARTYNAAKAVLWGNGIPVTTIRTSALAESCEKSEDEEGTSEAAMSEAEMREVLCANGYRVEKLSSDKMDESFILDPSLFEGDHVRFAVISCTQLGSKYQQITHLRNFYRLIQDQGIKLVLHAGDVVEGMDVYSGQEYELFLHGAKAQADYVIEHYPRMENGGKTLMIAGNHDYSFMQKAGMDIVQEIAQSRDDIEYLGAYGAYPETDYLRIYLQHGGGGGAYARSYKLQKNIEQMAPEAKPDLYFLGHYHTTAMLWGYRNVSAMMLGCFQSQTPFERRHGLYPEIGGFIVDATINDKTRKQTLAGLQVTWIPFFVPLEEDY